MQQTCMGGILSAPHCLNHTGIVVLFAYFVHIEIAARICCFRPPMVPYGADYMEWVAGR